MTNLDKRHANPNAAIPGAFTQEYFDVALPHVNAIREGSQNALKMLQDSQQAPGTYLVVCTTNGEPLPEMFVLGGTAGLRTVLSKKLEARFPALQMGKDIFAIWVTLK